MLYLGVKLYNPFSKRFKTLYYRNGFLTEHKAIEIQLMETNYIFEVALDITTQQDHAGFTLDLSLLGYSLNINIHDIRHWDYEQGKWKG